MRRILFPLFFAATTMAACGDDSTPGNQPDGTVADGTVNTDTLADTGGNTEATNQPETTMDTTPAETVPETTPNETVQETRQDAETTPTPTRQCTDAEVSTLNSCLGECADQACASACLTSSSVACATAYTDFVGCMQTWECFDEAGAADLECAAENCAEELEAVFGTPEPSDCNPVTSAGCESGEICTVGDQAGNLYCVQAGDVPAFGDCSDNPAGCATGLCLGSESEAVCMPFCDTNADCPDGRLCNVGLQGTDFTFCGDIPVTCDLLAQDCPNNQGCYIASQEGDTQCAPHNNKATGAACQFLNDCAPGNLCAGNGASGTCTALCDTTANPTTCTAGMTCSALAEDSNVGVCAAPPSGASAGPGKGGSFTPGSRDAMRMVKVLKRR